MILQRTVDTYCGLYDFAVTGGAIGSYDLNIPIPINFALTRMYMIPLTSPGSATGAATISFDIINNSVAPIIAIIGGLMSATVVGIGDFGIGGIFFGTDGVDGLQEFFLATTMPSGPGVPVQVIPSMIGLNAGASFPFSVGLSIGIEPLLAGKMIIVVEGVSFDLPN